MRAPASRPNLPGLDPEEADGGPRPADWALLVLRSVRRRPSLAVAVFLLAMDASAFYYRLKAPTYRVQTKFLAQRQQPLPSIARPTVGDDVPTRLAEELVHQHDNLVALVKAAALAPESAPPEVVDALVLRLDRALDVKTAEGTGTVTITVNWPNPRQAYQLAEAALQNFLEARHVREITAIDEVISQLQARAATLRQELDKATEQALAGVARASDVGARLPSPRGAPSEQLVRLKSMLDATERAIRDVEDFRRRRLADLQAQLDAQRGIYSEAHPNVINLRQDIAALERESPQAATLREQLRQLQQQYAARLAQEPRAQIPSPGPAGPPRALRPGEEAYAVDQDERVRAARVQYDRMMERLNAAQVDLGAARAAFRYRYDVIWPAEFPKDPASPDPLKVFGLGGLAAMLLAFVAAAAPDLVAGRIVERWQVERTLDVPIIMELRRR